MPVLDPLLKQIELALDQPLDGTTFEAAMCSMFREQRIYPKIVPVRGGGDAGMDGAIGDAGDLLLPIPLVCTTQEDVKANLARSLCSYKNKIGARNSVVFATSRSLSPGLQRQLTDAAKAKGFTLLNIYEQAVVAEMLYRSPRWCSELLRITTVRPSLSAFPQGDRPFIDQPLRGRDDDVAWLNAQADDLLLSGQPGIGKTFLLRTFAKAHLGLFAVTEDVAAIQVGIREQQPELVIVTDAHARLGLLRKLRQVRADTVGTWRIAADCWPGAEKEIRQDMAIPTAAVRALEPLSRDIIVTILKDAGLLGPTRLIREIVDQARGRAGLAATLAWLCLNGDYLRVGLGQALSEQIEATFKVLVGGDAMDVLAMLALGGEGGLPLAEVAAAVGKPHLQLQRLIVGMAAGGVVDEQKGPDGRSRIVVQPEALRDVLVSDRFFGQFRIDLPELVTSQVRPEYLTAVLLGAAHRNGEVPDELLRSRIGETPTTEVLESYAALGKSQAKWVLTRHADATVAIARIGLLVDPEDFIPELLTLSVGDTRPTHSNTTAPMRLLEDWVHGGRPGKDAIERRRLMVEAVGKWLGAGGDADTAVRATAAALVPTFQSNELDPGAGRTVTLIRGVIRPDELKALGELWKQGLGQLRPEQVRDWRPLVQAIAGVASPHVLGGSPGKEFHEAAAPIARLALREAAKLCRTRPGAMLSLSRLAKRRKMPFAGPTDLELDVLYPEDDWDDYREGWARAGEAARELARQFATQSPRDVSTKLARHASEADTVGLHGRTIPHFVGSVLAEDTQRLDQWLIALREAGCTADLIAPVLTAMYEQDPARWTKACQACWESPWLRPMVAVDVLRRTKVPAELSTTVLAWLPENPDLVETQCLRGEVTQSTLKQLLCHDNAEVAAAAAEGEWHRDRGNIAPGLVDVWRAAIVRTPVRGDGGRRSTGIGDILSNDPDLAFSWLIARVAEGIHIYEIDNYDLVKAVPSLTADQRHRLLVALATSKIFAPSDLVVRLVNNDVTIYQRLLACPEAERLHLAPLATHPTTGWALLAAAAMDAGYSPKQVYEEGDLIDGWCGEESAHWEKWRAEWAEAAKSSDPRLREVAAMGIRAAEARRKAAAAQEKREGIIGR